MLFGCFLCYIVYIEKWFYKKELLFIADIFSIKLAQRILRSKGEDWMKDYYQILGVRRDASAGEIKKAYRKLAKRYHPDSHQEDEQAKQRFQEISEAYKVLGDEKARKQYNAWGHETYTAQARHTTRQEGEDGHCGACQNRNPRPKEEGPPPASIRTAVHMSFEEVLTGATKTIKAKDPIPCPHCEKSRENAGATCPYCHGTGIWEKPREALVHIPARTYDGCFYHLEDVLDKGEKAFSRKNLVVVVLVDDQPGYIRQDYHLYSTMEISYPEMVLGGEIQIPTIEGDVRYVLAPGTSNGARIRLPGKGLWMPPKVGNRGDQYVTLQVAIPKQLTKEQQEALRQFQKLLKNG